MALQNDDEEISIVAEWLFNAWRKVLVFMDRANPFDSSACVVHRKGCSAPNDNIYKLT